MIQILKFIAHDKTHPDSEETYFMLNFVVYQMKLSCHEDNQERSLDVSMEDDLLIFWIDGVKSL